MIYGRPLGAVLWGTFLRITLVHHATFLINSLCHYKGRRTYDDSSTARDSWFVSWFTFGEGYHNYHHKFQWDYRNGIRWYDFDPSKWIIKFLSVFNIAYNLRTASNSSILKAKIETLLAKINLISIAKINNSYTNQINMIKNNAFKKIKLLKALELKYNSSIKNKKKLNYYLNKKKLYTLEIEHSISSLLLLFMNLKNLS